jgi:hypothetical protein
MKRMRKTAEPLSESWSWCWSRSLSWSGTWFWSKSWSWSRR